MQETLKKRTRVLNEATTGSGPVAYWMSRDQRVTDNWALIYAQQLALRQRVPLLVVFCCIPLFLEATDRHYAFMFAGLREISQKLEKLEIPFFLLTGEPAIILPQFIEKYHISSMVTDFDPLRIKRQWKEGVIRKIEILIHEVDAHNIVPCITASPKPEYGAYTIRKKITSLLPVFLNPFPVLKKHAFPGTQNTPRIDWKEILTSAGIGNNTGNLDWITPGEAEAHKRLKRFIEDKLVFYEAERNDPLGTPNRIFHRISISVRSLPSG
jgi:deoxyribodipyrimidine photo-lyase